jgi:hypothetical protein
MGNAECAACLLNKDNKVRGFVQLIRSTVMIDGFGAKAMKRYEQRYAPAGKADFHLTVNDAELVLVV